MLPASILPPGYALAHSVLAHDPSVPTHVKQPDDDDSGLLSEWVRSAAADSSALEAEDSVAATNRAARTLWLLRVMRTSSPRIRKPKPPVRPRARPRCAHRPKVPAWERTDNNLWALLKLMGHIRKEAVARTKENLMHLLTAHMGMVSTAALSVQQQQQPQLVQDFCIVQEKVEMLSAAYEAGHKEKRSAYSNRFKGAVLNLLSEDGSSWLQNVLLAN